MFYVGYSSVYDKQSRYVSETLPAIVRAGRSTRFGNSSRAPRQIHETLRRGRYVPEEWSGDRVQAVTDTLQYGGDCDDWAAVWIASAASTNLPLRLVTAGDEADHYRHVYVEVLDGGRWVASDPKGSQGGADYGLHSEWPVVRRWQISGDGVSEIVAGSGNAAPDPVIRSSADATKYMTADQMRIYLEKVRATQGYNAWLATTQALRGGYHARTRSQILSYIGHAINQAAATISAKTGAPVAGAEAYVEIFEHKALLDTNLVMASEWAAGMVRAGGRDKLREFAVGVGGNPNADDDKLYAVAVAYLADATTELGMYFDDWVAAYTANPNVKLHEVRADLAPTGSGSMFSEITGRVGRFLRKVFVTELGRAIRNAAKFILSADKNAPWLSLYFLRPLGFHAQATILRELGNAMVDGSINTFNEQAVARSAGQTFAAAGQALLIAAPLLPPPWNVAAAAVGALSLAVGKAINTELDRRAYNKAVEKGAADVTYTVDQYGRPVGPDGLPLDPMQREQEVARRAALAPDPGTQTLGEWRRGNDGLVYGWADLGQYGMRWLSLSVAADNKTILHAWAWMETQWLQLR